MSYPKSRPPSAATQVVTTTNAVRVDLKGAGLGARVADMLRSGLGLRFLSLRRSGHLTISMLQKLKYRLSAYLDPAMGPRIPLSGYAYAIYHLR